MARAYGDLSALISQKLHDTTPTEFSATMINFQVEECLKEIGARQPHLLPVVFNIESRHGQATSTSPNNLVDATKSQFLSTDPTNEKVIYNSTDHTWAVVETYTNAYTLALSADIMASGETYFIFNKRCRNNKQIFIGYDEYTTGPTAAGFFDPWTALRAEYPCNAWPRNWRNVKVVQQGVLELVLDIEPDDSDPTLSNLGRTEVVVEFNKPHVLSQLTDWTGELSADAAALATKFSIDGMGTSEVIEEGEEFHLENHRTLYTVIADSTMSSGAGDIYIYPPLEAAASDNDDIYFVKSSLSPTLEDILAELCTARLLINQAPKYFKLPSQGGMRVWQNLLTLGEHKLAETLTRLSRASPAITKRSYPSD